MAHLLECSFCCRTEREVQKLVAGAGGGHICDACAEIAVRIMTAEARPSLLARIRRFLGLGARRSDTRDPMRRHAATAPAT
jgi:ATP-dependent protease Clp ATPase subunit